MKIKVNKHNIEIDKQELINEKEVNVSKCYFEFSEDYTDSMVKKALFTKDNKTYEMLINNNECDYPSEILESEGTCVLGVYAYTTENEFTRFNPTPQKFAIELGSLRLSENSQPITPSEMEQYQQALQNGLNEVNKELEEVMQIGSEVAKQGEYATKQGNYAKSVGEQLEKDKENGLFKGEQGDTGEKGDTGPKGEPGKDGENGKDGQDGKDYVLTEADKQEIADNINEENNNRITSNEKYISELEATIDILTNTDTKKGELVHITDALPLATFENKISGNYEQETTKGNQLFDISTVKNAGITPNTGAVWTNTAWRLSDYIKIEENTPFTFSWVSDSMYFQAQGCYYDENKTYISGFDMTKDGVYSRTETTPGGTKYLRIAYSINVNGNEVTREDIMLNLGTTKLSWEKFTNGASPNPEYPQEIEVLEAYNRFNINTITENKYINADIGSIETSSVSNISDYIEIKHNKKLTLTYNYISLMNTGNRAIVYYDANKNFLRGFSYNPTNKSVLIGTPSDAKFIRFTYDKSFYDIQVVEGITDKPFVPYGCVGYKVNGKNIFDRNRNASTVNPTYENEKILWQGTGSYSFVDYKVNCKPNTKYAISFSDKNCVVILSKKSNSIDTINWDVANNYVFTTTDNMNEFYIRFTASGSLTYYVDKFQIELDKATPYEPHKEQIVPLDLKENWVGAINDNIKDYLVTDKKKYWLVKNVNRGVISIDNYPYENDTEMWFFFNKPTDSIDYGKYTTNGFSEVCLFDTTKPICFSGRGASSKYALLYDKTKIDTIPTNDEIKELVDGKYFYYQLKEPQIIELGKLPEPIKTFEGTNNIQLLANLDTELEVVYAQDVKKYYDNKLAEISAQII